MDQYNSNDLDNDADDKDLLKEAQERYRQADQYWNDHHQKTTELLRFVSGDQWTDQARQAFENNGYAAITDNVLPSFIRQITNELRQSTPSIVFNPMEDTESDKAEILNDLARNIQLDSNADIAYDTAGWMAAVTGIGYWRIINEYENSKSFNQKLCIVPIQDSNSVLLDPSYRNTTGKDADWGFISTSMSKDEYTRKFANSKLSNLDAVGWKEAKGVFLNDKEVIIAEYYYKDFEDRTLYQFYNKNNQQTTIDFSIDEIGVADGTIIILNSREVQVPVIHHCKLNQVEVLERTTFPGTMIPIVAVKGDELWIDEKRKIMGAVEPAIDAQVMLNYFLSLQAQLIQMAPKAPYIGTAQQFKTYEQQWADINISGQAFVPYNKDEGAPPPQRDLGEVPIQNMSNIVAQARDNLKQIFGIYDASLGAQGNEVSGKAILARQSQSTLSNYHFADNINRALQHTGEILLEAIPVFYDTRRIIQTVDPSGQKKVVPVNGQGEPDLTCGTYCVDIETGPSYGTKRQEAVTSMMELGNVYPNAMPVIADLIVNNMDWAGSKEIAARLRATVPQNILDASGQLSEQDAKQQVPQLKMALDQAQQNLKALNAHAEQVEQELKLKEEELHLTTLDKSIDVKKNEQEYVIKSETLHLNKEQMILEMQLEMARLDLEKRKLDLQEKQLEINTIKTSNDLSNNLHDKTIEHLDRISLSDIDTDETHLGGSLSNELPG
jgi:Phage P22-like portal protein